MRLLLIGPPGSGKGTQAVRIARHYGIAHISSGDLLRRHVAAGSTIGRTVAACLDRGDLVPDNIVMDILRKPVETAARRGGYILDGFPRTVAQARAAYRVAAALGAEVRIAVHLTVGRRELTTRLLARGAHGGRTDDTAQVIRHRLDVFDAVTAPLLGYYRERETLITVDGEQPVDAVTRNLVTHLDRARRHLGPPARTATTAPAVAFPRDTCRCSPRHPAARTAPVAGGPAGSDSPPSDTGSPLAAHDDRAGETAR